MQETGCRWQVAGVRGQNSVSCILYAVFFAVFLASGCASQWTLKTAQPEITLQWPYQPNRAKVTYVMTLNGFARTTSSTSLLRAIVYGASTGGNDTFILPVSAAAGHDGRLAVADTGCRCVHLYIPGTQQYLQISNADGEDLRSPVGVVFDDELRLYVSDSAMGKVFVFGSDGKFLFSLHRVRSGEMQRPTGLAYNRNRKLLYVVDTAESRIHAFDTTGENPFSFGGRGEAQGQFNLPTHIFWSPAGTLYITDSMNFRIQIFDDSGHFLGSFGHHGDGSGDLAIPKGVAADKDGTIYVVDSLFDNVQLFDRQGEFLLTVGSRGSDFGEFWLPSGISIDDGGMIYVCDTYNHRVQIFRITGN